MDGLTHRTRRRGVSSLFAVLAVSALAGCATVSLDPPTCPDTATVNAMVSSFVARTPMANPPDNLTMAGAECGRAKFVRALEPHFGRIVGYKAGLTNEAVQKRFNANAPVRGTLFEKSILRDGAEVPAAFGARPLHEADLVVAVRDSAIHGARTPAEVLNHVAAIHPFIELPDLAVQDPSRLNAAGITLINVGTRLGVLGAPIPVALGDSSLLEPLRDMRVRLLDDQGREVDSGRGAAILDHPLNAVIWLAADLRRSGVTLQPGDLLSLGSFTKLVPPKAGTGARVVYEGLPGNPSVSVRFR